MAKVTLQDERGYSQLFAPIGSTPIRAARRAAWFQAEARKVDARRVLEIGCGTGETAAHVARTLDAEVVAIDISPMFIEKARSTHQAPNLRFELLDLLGSNPLEFGRFDLVFGNGILHHLVLRLAAVLEALRAITNERGGFAFIEPNVLNPYCAFIFGTRIGRKFARLEPDEMAFTPGDLRRHIAEAGWRDVDVATRDFLVPGLPKALVRPTLAIEPVVEATALTRWLAQSHFATARA